MANLFIIAGPNGAGKTTASKTILPEMLNVKEFVNADEIARGISPYNPEGVAFEAGRYMLQRIKNLIAQKKSFAFETTLSTRTYTNYVKFAQEMGYNVTLCFLWLPNPEIALKRVEERVIKGGHQVPPEIVERRFERGLKNFRDIYMGIVDSWFVLDNTGHPQRLIAEGEKEKDTVVYVRFIWESILNF